jgi:hypothetical protein
MKRYIITSLFLISGGFIFAQDAVGDPVASDLGSGIPEQALKEVSVDKFETEGLWHSSISYDTGFSVSRLFTGSPTGKQGIPEEADLEIQDTYVLGTRVDFLRRGDTSIMVYCDRPIPVEGITKTVSVWVAGRNYNHSLKLLVLDYYNRYFELEIGRLNFQGWKKLTVAIPPQPPNGRNGIVQRDMHYTNLGGLKIMGFRIDIDPTEAYGTYYVYFDDLRATTDLFAETSREPDDPSDDW